MTTPMMFVKCREHGLVFVYPGQVVSTERLAADRSLSDHPIPPWAETFRGRLHSSLGNSNAAMMEVGFGSGKGKCRGGGETNSNLSIH